MANRRVSADRGFGRRPPSRGYRQARQRRWAFDSLSNVRSQFKHSVRRTPAGQVLMERRPSPHRGILVSALLDSASRRGRVGVTTWGTSGVAWPRISVPARESFSGLLIMGGRRSGVPDPGGTHSAVAGDRRAAFSRFSLNTPPFSISFLSAFRAGSI